MSSFIKIPLTESQKNLLQQKELTRMVEPETKLALSAILFLGETNTLCIDPINLEHLIEKIRNVTDYEVYNPKLARQYARLSGYLTDFLDKK